MLNRAILMGRLTSDPELKQTPNGVFVSSFSIAVNRNYNRDMTDFINIVAWRQTAEFVCRYFKKGQLIALEGSIQTRNYEDKNGNKRTAVEVVADQVHFAESKNSNLSNTQSFSMPSTANKDLSFDTSNPSSFSSGDFDGFEELEVDDDELPF